MQNACTAVYSITFVRLIYGTAKDLSTQSLCLRDMYSVVLTFKLLRFDC